VTDDLAALAARIQADIHGAADPRALEAVRVAALGKSGEVTSLLKGLGAVAPEGRKARGADLNQLKAALEAALDARRIVLDAAALDARLLAERQDMTLPARPSPMGAIHPITRTIEELTAIFGAMGFRVAEGPDIESDWHNFAALNIPDHHPARQDQDTFYLPSQDGGPRPVLRTHTSPVQARTMLTQEPPIRVIIPGRTWRADHDATHSPMFHQVEGLVIDRGITLGHLKGCLTDFLRAFFNIGDLPVRFRSSYFPLHRALDGGGHRLEPPHRRAGRGQRLAGDPGLRHGASARAGQLRHRCARVAGLRLRHGHRAHHHAQARHGRSASLLRGGCALAQALRDQPAGPGHAA
jgi:phenylalanyl-tRNA synthetase alpha chain